MQLYLLINVICPLHNMVYVTEFDKAINLQATVFFVRNRNINTIGKISLTN